MIHDLGKKSLEEDYTKVNFDFKGIRSQDSREIRCTGKDLVLSFQSWNLESQRCKSFQESTQINVGK